MLKMRISMRKTRQPLIRLESAKRGQPTLAAWETLIRETGSGRTYLALAWNAIFGENFKWKVLNIKLDHRMRRVQPGIQAPRKSSRARDSDGVSQKRL